MKRPDWRFWLKCVLLAVVDTLTIWLLFSFWSMYHYVVFPWALLNVLAVLFIADTVVLAIPHIQKLLHAASATSIMLITAFYYIFTIVFTGLTYLWIKPQWYFGASLLFLFAFLGCFAGIYVFEERRPKNSRNSGQAGQLQSLMLDLGVSVRTIHGRLEERTREAFVKAYETMRAGVEFATPFGRSIDPVVQDMEDAILSRVGRVNEEAREFALMTEIDQIRLKSLMAEFLEINELIRNREKRLA